MTRVTVDKVAVEEVRTPLRDGTRLAADVIRVDDGRRRPVLLIRSPYLRPGVRQNIDVVGLARQGWVVVGQDTRGRGDSEGSAEPFVHEAADGADSVAWCARQPWSDGRVAMAGGSYLSFAQWAAARGGARALRAISPVAAPDGLLRNWHFEGGAFCTGLVTSWNALMAQSDPAVPARDRKRIAELTSDWPALLATPLGASPLRELYPPYARALDPRDRAYWRQFDTSRRYAKLDLPAFQVAGWYDVFVEGGIRSWQALRREAASEYARASQRLIVGPWVHTGMFLPATAELNFGPAANGLADGTAARIYSWLREAIDGEEVEGGARVFVMGRGDWVELPDWPPPSTPLELHLGAARGARSLRGDGELTTAPGPAGSDRYLHDPRNPVPTRGGRILVPVLPHAGPSDQRLVEERDDVLVFTSPTLTEDLTVMGTIEAHVVAETTGRSADVTAKLVDVHPEGRALNVVDSITRSAFSPGRPKAIRVELGSTAQTFRRGHRIRLEIASSNFPHFDVNPSTGEAPADATRHEPALQTIRYGGRTGSRLVLPVVDGAVSGR
jgi:uncharacterized protein